MLDTELNNQHFQIYEVDGLRGTLKELSDYFNVNPIEVADLLSENKSIQDALCLASTNKNGKRGDGPVEINHYSDKIAGKIREAFDEYINNPDIKQIDLATKYNVSSWTIQKNLKLYAKNTHQEEAYAEACKLRASRRTEKANQTRHNFVENVVESTNVPVEVKLPKNSYTENKNAVMIDPDPIDTKTPVTTKAVTDVQDLGDLIVITTTTTVVYRKDR